MPHTGSAKKRLRQSEKRRLRNRSVLRAIKEQIKNVKTAAGSGDVEQLRGECSKAARLLDKAAVRRVVHSNLAARKKSQLARLLRGKESAGKPG